jgi:hypothetical protein
MLLYLVLLALASIFIYLCESRSYATGAEELSQKIEYDYGDDND